MNWRCCLNIPLETKIDDVYITNVPDAKRKISLCGVDYELGFVKETNCLELILGQNLSHFDKKKVYATLKCIYILITKFGLLNKSDSKH